MQETTVNEQGEQIITYSNGNSDNLGRVVGRDAADGMNGQDGKDGIDGDKGDTGDRGEKGDKGDKGEKGDTGAAGADGIGVANAEITSAGEVVISY